MSGCERKDFLSSYCYIISIVAVIWGYPSLVGFSCGLSCLVKPILAGFVTNTMSVALLAIKKPQNSVSPAAVQKQ